MDYEALGRYTAAAEAMGKAARERNMALAELGRLVRRTIDVNMSGAEAMDFNPGQARELLEKATVAHHDLARAVVDANSCAQAAGKPEVRLR